MVHFPFLSIFQVLLSPRGTTGPQVFFKGMKSRLLSVKYGKLCVCAMLLGEHVRRQGGLCGLTQGSYEGPSCEWVFPRCQHAFIHSLNHSFVQLTPASNVSLLHPLCPSINSWVFPETPLLCCAESSRVGAPPSTRPALTTDGHC